MIYEEQRAVEQAADFARPLQLFERKHKRPMLLAQEAAATEPAPAEDLDDIEVAEHAYAADHGLFPYDGEDRNVRIAEDVKSGILSPAFAQESEPGPPDYLDTEADVYFEVMHWYGVDIDYDNNIDTMLDELWKRASPQEAEPDYLDTEAPEDPWDSDPDPFMSETEPTCKCGSLLTVTHIYEHLWARASYVVREDPTAPPEHDLLLELNDTQLRELFEWCKTDYERRPCTEDVWVLRAFQHEFEMREAEALTEPPDYLDTEVEEDQFDDREPLWYSDGYFYGEPPMKMRDMMYELDIDIPDLERWAKTQNLPWPDINSNSKADRDAFDEILCLYGSAQDLQTRRNIGEYGVGRGSRRPCTRTL